MDGKLKIPPLPKQAEETEEEQHYLLKSDSGFLASVPESKLEDWDKAQKTGSRYSDKFIKQVTADLMRRLMEK